MSEADAAGGRPAETYTNRLIHSHDPYLLLHAHNPVDWYPWGPEALEKAKRENKPIFLSVGYSTCYWCHVAEREIYSNPQIAKLMNHWFINIKVDREQRPDIDRVYMLATQILTGGGGWPNNVFLTPDLKPFFAGSYFPPKDTDGRPGFPTVLKSLHQAWAQDPAKVRAVADRVEQALRQARESSSSADVTPEAWLSKAQRDAAERFDEFDGGFGDSVKFPQAPLLSMLLALNARDHDAKTLHMVNVTLQAMAEGAVMDQLAGGFHRYSTDPGWNVPHFEKMLYDNAQLLGLYARAYAITKQPLFKQVALRTADYLSTEMRAPAGGFYSAQDAEVGGIEGASYMWTRAQIEAALGAGDASRWFELYVLKPMPPPFAGQRQPEGDVLRLDRSRAVALAHEKRLAEAISVLSPLREKLLAVRNRRPQPARDEKIVTADNALAILGFAEAGEALDDKRLLHTAVETADWEWRYAFDPSSGLLRHQFFQGHPGDDGFLDDYALLAQAYLRLQTITGNMLWLRRAQQLADAMLQRFALPSGALAETWDRSDLLVVPPAEGDSVKPSGQSAAVAALLELSAVTGEQRYAAAARAALASLAGPITAQPSAWGALLAALARPPLLTALERASAGNTRMAGGLPSSADHVHVTARLQRADSHAELLVSVNIDPGYHINANPASDPDLIPTQLTIDGQAGAKVEYPPAQTFKAPFAPDGLAVYTGRVTLRAHLPTAPRAPVSARLRVQACNDQYCLAPATLTIHIESPQ